MLDLIFDTSRVYLPKEFGLKQALSLFLEAIFENASKSDILGKIEFFSIFLRSDKIYLLLILFVVILCMF